MDGVVNIAVLAIGTEQMVTGEGVPKVVQARISTGRIFQADSFAQFLEGPHHRSVPEVPTTWRADKRLRAVGMAEPLVAGLLVPSQLDDSAVSDRHQSHGEVLTLTHDEQALAQIHVTVIQCQHFTDTHACAGKEPDDGCVPQAGERVAAQRGLVRQTLANRAAISSGV